MKLILAGMALAAAVAAADDVALQTFTQRLNEYAKLRKSAADALPALPKETKPADIANHESALAAAIRKARPNAKQGDIFLIPIRPKFAALLKSNLSGAANADNRATAQQGNPKNNTTPGETTPNVQVNAVYPKNAPQSSVPPQLLLQLPQLPPDIEYHFVGNTLVLLDSQSNLIIDYLKEVAPPL